MLRVHATDARSAPRAVGPVVLIGFAEALAAIETAWSLQSAGFRVVAFRRSGTRPALRHVRGVELHEVPPPEEGTAATLDAMRRLLDSVRPSVLLPLDDAAVLVCSRLGDAGVPVAGPTGFAAECALDKGLQLAAAREAGVPVPETRVLDDPSEAGTIDAPVMIKPARALYEVDGRLVRPSGMICANDEELRRAATRSWHAPLLKQPLIYGAGEGLFGHVGPDGVVAWSAHRRVRMVNPHGSASAACRSHPVDQLLVGPSERFLKAIGWRGLFMLEFLRDVEGKPWFVELNGRTWGSMALSRRRGFEYPAWTVRAALDPSFVPSPPVDPADLVCRNVGLELVHLMFVARGPQSDAPVDWPRLGRTLGDICKIGRADRLYNWNPRQPSVLLADMTGTVGGYLRRMAGRQ